jgi:soluble lytic murein transglycosylase-like protein
LVILPRPREARAQIALPAGVRPRSAAAGAGRLALFIAALVCAATACRQPPPPALAGALAVRGDAAARARASLVVARDGAPAERRRAALLWGLFACDVPSPVAALRAFAAAAPSDGVAVVAARRLEEAMASSSAPAEAWADAAAAPWLPAAAARRLRLRAAERFRERGDEAAAARALPPIAELAAPERLRAFAVLAGTRAGGAAARRRLAIEFPGDFASVLPGEDLAAIERTLTAAEWAESAAALLAAGDAGGALRAARRAGGAAALTGARAALRLRRPREALAWADRLGAGNVEGAVERAEAWRQLAWSGPRGERQAGFARALAAAERARRLAGSSEAAARRADLILAEACVELGRLADAEAPIARSFDRSVPRWEWVWRRLALRAGERRDRWEAPASTAAAGPRVRRIVAYWQARGAARAGDPTALRALADSGFPDLPALWSAAELGRRGVAVALTGEAAVVPPPPAWAADLLAAGRVADVIVAWRSDLERGPVPDDAWLGLLALAEMPAIEAVPLLLRAEPRLLSGPWAGLPRELLARYLPLPLRGEVEAAARRAGVPPWLLAGVVRQESAWSPQARSAAGAVGLAQVVPATGIEKARALGLRGTTTADLLQPATNLLLGASLLADWRRSLGGSWTAAVAAYNGGERRAREVWELARRHDGPEFVEALEIPETHDYVHRVVLLAEGYRMLYWPEGSAYPWT